MTPYRGWESDWKIMKVSRNFNIYSEPSQRGPLSVQTFGTDLLSLYELKLHKSSSEGGS